MHEPLSALRLDVVGPSIILPPDRVLRQPAVVRRVAIAAAAEGFPRREWPNVIADALYGYEGSIFFADGRRFEPTDTEIDDTFDDPDFRWISDFLSFAEVGPRQRAQLRTVPRIRLFYVNFRIRRPERARMILE